ncbi:PD-(D/E)XK nuclease family protein [Candidatus Woesearchaeota archaeon]|nr:PD-(D/E)XK nuclease family protein [Candidatus Woesearchaeota archaeon]
MDRILKAHFDAFRDKGELPPEMEKLNGRVKLFDNVELLEQWRKTLKGIQWTDEKGNLFRGAVDNILQKGKKLIVLDYKTRGYPVKEDTAEHYKDQLDIYNFLLRKNGYETEDYGYLMFYYPKEVEADGDVAFHTELVKMEISVKNAERIFKEAVDVVDGKMPKSAEGCGYCKWALANNNV